MGCFRTCTDTIGHFGGLGGGLYRGGVKSVQTRCAGTEIWGFAHPSKRASCARDGPWCPLKCPKVSSTERMRCDHLWSTALGYAPFAHPIGPHRQNMLPPLT
eukprot:1693214-Pyramimonas_sp.AAC.1